MSVMKIKERRWNECMKSLKTTDDWKNFARTCLTILSRRNSSESTQLLKSSQTYTTFYSILTMENEIQMICIMDMEFWMMRSTTLSTLASSDMERSLGMESNSQQKQDCWKKSESLMVWEHLELWPMLTLMKDTLAIFPMKKKTDLESHSTLTEIWQLMWETTKTVRCMAKDNMCFKTDQPTMEITMKLKAEAKASSIRQMGPNRCSCLRMGLVLKWKT